MNYRIAPRQWGPKNPQVMHSPAPWLFVFRCASRRKAFALGRGECESEPVFPVVGPDTGDTGPPPVHLPLECMGVVRQKLVISSVRSRVGRRVPSPPEAGTCHWMSLDVRMQSGRNPGKTDLRASLAPSFGMTGSGGQGLPALPIPAQGESQGFRLTTPMGMSIHWLSTLRSRGGFFRGGRRGGRRTAPERVRA